MFIELTKIAPFNRETPPHPTTINISQIVDFEPREYGTKIYYNSTSSTNVSESYEEVKVLIEEKGTHILHKHERN